MPGGVNFLIVAALIAGIVLAVVLAFAALSLGLRAQNRHAKRLARVGRRRLSGRLDLEDARVSLARVEQGASPLSRLADALAGVFPLLDKTSLKANLARAGLKLSLTAVVALSLVAAGLVAAIGHVITGLPAALLAVPSVFAGAQIVNGAIRLRGEAMANRFMKQMPDAIDTIIRGVRSGLPVVECIQTAGQETPDPIGPYFRDVSERVQLGESLDGGLWRVARVINRPEMDFFAVSISIQAETGGSLAEALGNLADLLRKREHMKLKIKAISSEAKASALIIGALPFLMLGLLSFMSPDYVMPLFTDPRGQTMLAMGLASIGAGAFVMWRMTQFEI